MAKDAGANLILRLVEEGGHLMAPALHGHEFEDRMAEFFHSALEK
jgi:hypothetical protein